jgi:hypothetical protein
LLRRFENGEDIHHFVRQHLRCGALVASPSCESTIRRSIWSW